MNTHRLYEQSRKKTKKRKQRIKICLSGVIVVIFLLLIYIGILLAALMIKTIEYQKADGENTITQDASGTWGDNDAEEQDGKQDNDTWEQDGKQGNNTNMVMEKLESFAEEHHFSIAEYPAEMVELLEKNPETEEFVLNYPLKKNTYDSVSLNGSLNRFEVPLFLQWDSRWGYYVYGDKPMGLTGCGPTCLSMVALHLLQDAELTPVYIADFSQKNGFYVEGTGTAWALMTQGAAELGLHAEEVTLDENAVMHHLENGHPIICAMGAGDFTDQGHFIVFTGVKDGKIMVNDPNSKIRSEKLWSFEDIKYQIKNMWVYKTGLKK